MRNDILLIWKDHSDKIEMGDIDTFLGIIDENYSEEDFFSLVDDIYNWELPIIGKVDPEKCFKQLAPDTLEKCIDEEKEYIIDEVESIIEDMEPFEMYNVYNFSVFVIPKDVDLIHWKNFTTKLRSFFNDNH